MLATELRSLLDHVERTWPSEDKEELAAYAREIEARRTGIYVMSEDERAAVEEGLAQADRGEFVDEATLAQDRQLYGV